VGEAEACWTTPSVAVSIASSADGGTISASGGERLSEGGERLSEGGLVVHHSLYNGQSGLLRSWRSRQGRMNNI